MITKDISIEELSPNLIIPSDFDYLLQILRKAVIELVRDLFEEKGFSDSEIDKFVKEINNI